MTAETRKPTMIQITPKDEELLALLKADSREPVAALARKLGLSRTTVQDRLARLREAGVIAAFTIRLAREADDGGMRAGARMRAGPRPGGIVDVAPHPGQARVLGWRRHLPQ